MHLLNKGEFYQIRYLIWMWLVEKQFIRKKCYVINTKNVEHLKTGKIIPLREIMLGTDHLTWRGGYGFLFRSEIFFRTTQELEYLLFFQNLKLGYMTKTLNQIIFFPPPNSEYFFQQHCESEYFFRKNHTPPPFMLNGRSLTKLKRKSLNQYFVERCVGGPKSKDFWPTIKPFFFYQIKDVIPQKTQS
jgi:hypothetical protein